MAWAEKTDSTVTLGKWADWTANWNTGPDLFGATNATAYNHRWTKVGGCLYAHGRYTMTAGSNFGYGGTWTLWFPSEWGGFVNTAAGGRIIGDGFATGSTRALHFQVHMVNTFNAFAVPVVVHNQGGPSQNFNAGADNRYILDTNTLSWIANGGFASLYYNFRFITDANT